MVLSKDRPFVYVLLCHSLLFSSSTRSVILFFSSFFLIIPFGIWLRMTTCSENVDSQRFTNDYFVLGELFRIFVIISKISR